MNTSTKNNDTEGNDGFTIFRRTRHVNNRSGDRSSNRSNNRSNNRSSNRGQGNTRRNERMTLLHNVASGDIDPETAVNLLNRSYSHQPARYHHSITRDGKVEINGFIAEQSVVLYIDEWQKFASYLGGNNFKNFVEYNKDRLKTKRPPRKPRTETQTNTTNTTDTTDTTDVTDTTDAIDTIDTTDVSYEEVTEA